MISERFIVVLKLVGFVLAYLSLLVFLAIFASGCASKPIPVAYQCPKLRLPPDPILPIEKLKITSTPDQVAKACVATITSLRGWNSAVRQEVTLYHV